MTGVSEVQNLSRIETAEISRVASMDCSQEAAGDPTSMEAAGDPSVLAKPDVPERQSRVSSGIGKMADTIADAGDDGIVISEAIQEGGRIVATPQGEATEDTPQRSREDLGMVGTLDDTPRGCDSVASLNHSGF